MIFNTDFKHRKKKKFCRFKKHNIKHVDYKDIELLKKFTNDFGQIIPAKNTGNSVKFQKKVARAIKRARQIALMPYLGNEIE